MQIELKRNHNEIRIALVVWLFRFRRYFDDGTPYGQSVADFPELLKQVPDTANIILLMKSKEIAANASLSANNQIKQFLDAAKSWPVVAQWEPQQIVIAAEMDIAHMAPIWEMAALDLGKKPDLNYLARRTRGMADNLLGFKMVWLEKACALATGDQQLTFVSPLNRQSATRWLQRDQESRIRFNLSPTWPNRLNRRRQTMPKSSW